MSLGNATPTWGTQDQYRVLKIDGSIAEVMAMYQISSSRKWNYDTSSYSSTATANYTYNGSLLDTYLNTTWYATLSSDAKNAIVAKTIKQNKCDSNFSSYNATTHASYATYPGTVFGTMSRNVYALDIEDIEEYFGGSSSSIGTYSTDDIKTMFGSPSTTEWLRSARGGSTSLATAASLTTTSLSGLSILLVTWTLTARLTTMSALLAIAFGILILVLFAQLSKWIYQNLKGNGAKLHNLKSWIGHQSPTLDKLI